MSALNRDAILAADDLERVEVPVPEWGGKVFVRQMTGAEMHRIRLLPESEDADVRLVIWTCTDEAGAQLFNDGDYDKLSQKRGHIIRRIATAAIMHNSPSAEDAGKS